MKHLSPEEMTLYTKNLGLSVDMKFKLEQHLQTCASCQKNVEKFRQEISAISEENRQLCRSVYENILAFFEGNLDSENKLLVETHLKECNRCQMIYDKLADSVSWDSATQSKIEIPASSRKNIESRVLKKLASTHLKKAFKNAKEKVSDKIDELINEVILIFHPVQPGAVFRGIEDSELKVIEHPGGDLKIDTGINNVPLQLTSIFEEISVNGKTDKDGVVIFKNLKKGDYVVKINGYHLDDINQKY